MAENHNILISKLDEFIRKYYKNQLVKGLIYSAALLLVAFLAIVLAEYFAEFGIVARTVLFYSFIGLSAFVLTRYIVIPLLKLNRIGSTLTYEEASSIIGSHFSNIQDKLLNTLQLQNNHAFTGSDDLLLAGISQKIAELKPVPFSAAINISENKRYLKYVIPPLFITMALIIIWPHIITSSTSKLIHHQTYFEKQAPFSFVIANKDLNAVQQQDYELVLNLKGNEIPGEVFIETDGIEHKMEKENNVTYKYTFKNVQKNVDFVFNAAGFNSSSYELNVLPKPILTRFEIQLNYPAYLNKKNESVSNTGDLSVPQGTKVTWLFYSKNADDVVLHFPDSTIRSGKSGEQEFTFAKRLMQSSPYSIKAVNQFIKNGADSVSYAINVLADQFPAIDVSEKKDSLNLRNIYFSGSVRDDYGFSRLVFKYTHYTQDSSGTPTTKNGEQVIGINKQKVSQPYFYFFDGSRFNLKPGDKVEYYFEVWDNDGVNGNKSSKTQVMSFKAPTVDEMNEHTDKNNSEIKSDLDESIKKAKQLQKDLNDMSRKMADKKQLGWEEKKKLEDILNKQKELQQKIEEAKQENQLNNQQQQEFTPPDESILEKQKQLEKLFENIMTPEMKKLFDELNKMLDKLDKNQVQQKLEEMKLTNKDLEKELDRTLESFKQLEVEQKMQQTIDKLDELSKKQDDLSKQSEQKNADNKQLEQKQNELNKEFDQLKKDVQELEKKNESLEEPNALPKTEEQQNEISKEMQNSSDQLNQNNKKNASKSQKNASDKMQEMKNAMQKSLDTMQEEQPEENMKTLRQILENLLHLSFSQEDLMNRLSKTTVNNPQFTKIPQEQKKLQDDSRIIEDSLLALSKREPQISAMVNREISAIHMNMGKAVDELAERMQGNAQMRMQYSMTSINNLSLLLNEVLEQMQKQMQESKKEGNGSCKKPGKGKPSSKPGSKPGMANMRQMQQQLNQQLEDLKKALENGQKPGDKPGDKPGQKPGGQKPGGMGMGGTQGQNGSQMMPGMSEQLAKMAAQQEAIRRQMQQLMDQIKGKGGNPGGNLADLMEQTEKDLVNKHITQETMKRQQEIMTKLLESEKAEREREQDEERKSNEAKNQNYSNPTQFLEYKRMKEKELELLNTVPPGLTPYYKDKVNNYFNSVNK
ncbi:MAG: hypothetical protein JST26_04235 [Bacteroidetes bacterium]|nr:hypothetical protein [Bacteroidota bacterium]